MLILRELFNGNGRFNGVVTETGAPPAIVSDRLGTLERDGIIERRPYSTRGDRFDRLTAKGRDLYPVLLSLMVWGDRWMTDGEPPVQLRHRPCGHMTTPTMVCSACGDALDPRAMERHTVDHER